MKASMFIFIFVCCFAHVLTAQQDDGVVAFNLPVRNSLVFNRFAINPTFTFVREQHKYITFNNKRQHLQFDNAPEAFMGSFSGRFSENIGAGVSAFQQNYGVLTTFGGLLNFAYNIKLNTDSNLTFGINTSAYKSGINTSNVVTNFEDPSLQNVSENFLITVNPGINYGTRFLDFGIAFNNLVLYNIETSTMIEDDPQKGIQAHVMHTGYFDGRGFLKDTKFSGILMSQFLQDQTIISGIASLSIPRGLWMQVGYNSRFGVSGGVGLNITKSIALEYNIEKAIGNLVEFGASHEVSLAYRFVRKKKFDYSGDENVSGLFSKKRNKPIVKATEEELAGIRERAAERRAKAKLDNEAKALAEQQAKAEAKKQAELLAAQKAEAERLAQEKAKAKALAEQQAKAEAEKQAQLLAAQKAEAERLAQEKAKAKALAEQQAKAEAKKQAQLLEAQKAEAERLAQEKAKAKALAEQQAKAEAQKQAELLAVQKAEAERLAQEEAKAKALAEQQAKAEAQKQAELLAAQKAQAKAVAEQEAEKQTNKEPVINANDKLGKSIEALTKDTEASNKTQDKLIEEFESIVSIKNEDLKDLKEENDLSDQGIAVQPKPFKSVTEENKRLKGITSSLDDIIKSQDDKLDALKKLYKQRFKTTELDEVNVYFRKKIDSLTSQQAKTIVIRDELNDRLERIKKATEFEKRRRIKRAAYDNKADRYSQDRAMLQNIKRTTKPADKPYTEDDFDFGEPQGENIKILKNVSNTENGYYLIIAVHSDKAKRDEFLTKVVASGRANVDFFYDVNTSKYYIYYSKFNSISAANKVMETKGNRPYNVNMSLVKIEN